MREKIRSVKAHSPTTRVGDVVIRVPIIIEDGYDEDSNTLQFAVRPRSFHVHVTNPDHPRGHTFIRSRSRLTVDAALRAMRDEGSFSPGLHEDSGMGYRVYAEGLEDWVREVMGVCYVAHAAAEAMAQRTVEDLLRVRARFPNGLDSEPCLSSFGHLLEVTKGSRFETLTLDQLAEVSGCPDPDDVERLANCLEETDDERVPDAWLSKPRAGSAHVALREEAPSVSAEAIAACADNAAFARLVEGPPPRTPEAMAEALRAWMRFPTEARVQGSGFGFWSRTLIVRWAGGWTAVLALRGIDPAGAARFEAEFETVSTAEVNSRRNSRGTGVAGQMSGAAARIVEQFVALMRAQAVG